MGKDHKPSPVKCCLPFGRRPCLRRVALFLAVALALAGRAFAADTLTSLYDFAESQEGRTAGNNATLVQDAAGNFYGTTYGDYGVAGSYGTVFRLAPDGTFTVLYRFGDANEGVNPAGALTLASDGNLYGTTSRGGGPSNSGTVFRLTPNGTLTTLHTFDGPADGAGIGALTEGADGGLYGTAADGGANNAGTFFRVTTGGEFTVLHAFGGDEGSGPGPTLAQGADGNFYGTTSGPTEGDLGGIFRATPSGTVTRLHRFTNAADGSNPGPLLAGSDGSLYGVTSGGGPGDGVGTVFRLALDGTFTVLHTFLPNAAGYDPAGDEPVNGLTEDGDGNLYGVTYEGEENDGSRLSGTVFRLATDGMLTTLHKFRSLISGGAAGTPLLGQDGALYGVTLYGGANDDGFAYRVTTDSVAPVVAQPPVPTLPVVNAAVVRTNKIADTETGQFQLILSAAQTTDLGVTYQITGSGVAGVDYAALKGHAKIKAGATYKNINLRPIAIPAGAGTRTAKSVKLTLLPGNGYTVGTALTTVKIKIVHP